MRVNATKAEHARDLAVQEVVILFEEIRPPPTSREVWTVVVDAIDKAICEARNDEAEACAKLADARADREQQTSDHLRGEAPVTSHAHEVAAKYLGRVAKQIRERISDDRRP